MIRKLAKINSANLEIKERGILNFCIQVQYEDNYLQGIGCIALDEFSGKEERRVGAAYGCEMIRLLLLELDVNDFSEVKEQVIWVVGEGEGLRFKPLGIQSLSVNGGKEPLIFDSVLLDMRALVI